MKIYTSPGWLPAFEKAIDSSTKSRVEMKGVDSIESYLLFLQRFLHWTPSENENGTAIYDAFCLFYFILDQPALKELGDCQVCISIVVIVDEFVLTSL